MRRPIAVIFHRFGPYHCARLRALAAQGPAIGIEVVRKDTTYDWNVVDNVEGFQRVTLFPNLTSGEPRVAELRRRLYRFLDTEKPRAVAIPGWEASYALLALAWCLRTSTPAVLMSESTVGDRPRTIVGESVKRKLLRLYQAALVGGKRHAEYLNRLGFPEAAVLPGYDIVDNSYFGGLHPTCDVGSEAKHSFLVSCRFVAVKNLQRLLEAYARYRQEAGSMSWDLVLAGDGPEKANIVNAIGALNLGASVRLPGFVQYDQLQAMYARARAFILPSVSEPWGLVVNEAMAAGLPVLVSNRCGCVPELVHELRNGFTFDPFKTEELANLMLRVSSMTGDARAAMGRASQEIISRWTPETFATNLMEAAAHATAALPVKATVVDKALLWALIQRHQVIR